MPETTPATPTPHQNIIAAWPLAHAKAVDALAGVGANEPTAKHHRHRHDAAAAAHNAFAQANIAVKKVKASITWGGDRPMVSLELVTMNGDRFGGGEQMDARQTMVADVSKSPAAAPAFVPQNARDFFAGLAEDEDRRDAGAGATAPQASDAVHRPDIDSAPMASSRAVPVNAPPPVASPATSKRIK